MGVFIFQFREIPGKMLRGLQLIIREVDVFDGECSKFSGNEYFSTSRVSVREKESIGHLDQKI